MPKIPGGTERSYLICATPRTGSYLLCDALTATGVAGRPTEYLMASYREHWTARWGTSAFGDFHERVLAEGTTPNGVFGAKIHSGQFLEFLRRVTGRPRLGVEERAAVVEEWFPRPRYVWLRRRDQVRQAVSWVKACQTHLWWDADDPPAPMAAPQPGAMRFDYQFIERALYSLAEWDGVWRTYFDATGIEAHPVWYEDLVADRAGVVAGVMDFLGLTRPDDGVAEPPRYRRQADDTSAAWAARFGRLHAAKREATLASLAGMHAGETVSVCTSDTSFEQIDRDAVTIAVDGAPSPVPASYALLTRTPVTEPAAGVVFTTGPVSLHHPFVIRLLLDRRGGGEPPARNRLAVDGDESGTGIAVALASHLGAERIEVV